MIADNINEKTNLLKSNLNRNYGCMEQSIEKFSQENDIRNFNSFNSSDPDCFNYTDSENLTDIQNTADLSSSLYRNRYYSRLGFLGVPSIHLLPPNLFPLQSQKNIINDQSNLVTIFSLWNTMIGASLLTMPWAIQQAGFVLGILLIFFVASIAFYTAYLVLKSTDNLPLQPGRMVYNVDFSDACRFYLGKPAEVLSILFSFLSLLSGLVVYYVLLCNFLYFTVKHIYDYSVSNISVPHSIELFNLTFNDVICPSVSTYDFYNSSCSFKLSHLFMIKKFMLKLGIVDQYYVIFNKLWSQTLTVPFWLLIIIIPLISVKSPTFFTKFNALGTVSMVYMLILVLVKTFKWGIHMDFWTTDKDFRIPIARPTFIVLTGLSSLAFFIHNAVHSIMRNQSKPDDKVKNLSLAYVFVTLTYLAVGVLFYIAFPFPKHCIQDNLLNNLSGNDVLGFIARIALFFQLLTVFPLLMHILCSQLMYFFCKRFYQNWIQTTSLQFLLLGICITFSVLIPHIGEITRFSGAICGLVYVFALPSVVKIQIMRKQNTLKLSSLAFHTILIIIGVANFLGQFVFYF